MFKNPFSFEGRIRRSEFGISIILSCFINAVLGAMTSSDGTLSIVGVLLSLPSIYFSIAQGTKRCHDLGKNGFWQFIPFYGLWLFFADGQIGPNEFGENPKNLISSATKAKSTSKKTQLPPKSINLKFPFEKKNYQLLLIGVGTILLGYMLMMGGGSADPNVFDPSIFSFQRITLAPIVVLVGYALIGYAIMYKPKKKTEA